MGRSKVEAAIHTALQSARAQKGEAEPVAHQWRTNAGTGDWNHCDPDSLDYYRRSENHEVRELFADHPTPGTVGGVPVELAWPSRCDECASLWDHGYRDGWNGFRKAMLTAAPSPEQGQATVGCPCGGDDGMECPGPDGRLLCDDEQGQAAPEPLINICLRILQAHELSEVDWDAMRKLKVALSNQAEPGSGWIRCSEQLPKVGQKVRLKRNGDTLPYEPSFRFNAGEVFWDFDDYDAEPDILLGDLWMPTGLKRPNPPAEGEA